MKKRATIKDIAQALGLHHTTVSRALRNHPGIQEETRKRVEEMAKKLNYRPNTIAQNLKQQKTNTVGVIVPEIKHKFFSEVISGIEDVAFKKGYVILVSQSNESFTREQQNVQAYLSNHVAGVIASISQETKSSTHFKSLVEHGVKLVFFDRVCDDLHVDKVVVDDYQGAFKATEHLLKKGYKRIAHVGGTPDIMISQARYKGYCDALKKHAIPIDNELVVFSGFDESDGIKGGEKLLKIKNRPQAVFAVNDPVALGLYEILDKRGFSIPDDMAVVGFSNNPVAGFVSPGLTTINQPVYEIGNRAAELLFDQIEQHPLSETPRLEMLSTELIVRSST